MFVGPVMCVRGVGGGAAVEGSRTWKANSAVFFWLEYGAQFCQRNNLPRCNFKADANILFISSL